MAGPSQTLVTIEDLLFQYTEMLADTPKLTEVVLKQDVLSVNLKEKDERLIFYPAFISAAAVGSRGVFQAAAAWI